LHSLGPNQRRSRLRLLVQHRSLYRYPRPAALGPHRVRLRPANHARARVETYALRVPEEAAVRWQQDPSGNHVATLSFRKGARLPALAVEVELAVDVRPVNPFDFFVDPRCEDVPFAYPQELGLDLAPFLEQGDPALARGARFEALLAELPAAARTVPFIVEANGLVNRSVRYVIREEAGIWTPEETLAQGRGSCRDQAVLLMALLRARGIAARFASGYLVQLTDEGMIPDEPKGVGRDVVDLHAWAEVYLPGAGWIGLDPTSGLLTGEGHIPLACVARPSLAAPIDGTADVAAEAVSFELKVGRLGHEVRPTAPFPEAAWDALLAGGDRADALLAEAGLRLTSGGEPTFNARERIELPEWNGEALGQDKWERSAALARALLDRLAPGGVVQLRQGKWYPGESLPRWALELVGRADGLPVWEPAALPAGPADVDAARRVAEALVRRLGVDVPPEPAFEDPWPAILDEERLPVGVDPLARDLASGEERLRLSRLLGRGLGTPAAFVVPLARDGAGWRAERWRFRRGHLFLVPGDAPAGLRLPLASLGGAAPPPEPPEPALPAPDPRLVEVERARQARLEKDDDRDRRRPPPAAGIRTALCVEARGGSVHVFLPPLASGADFLALAAAVDGARRDARVDVLLEGYPPPPSPALRRLSVTPDPGVVEVNVPPASSAREHAAMLETVFDAALHAGLHSEKYLLDGRLAGSGGGHHLTLGGPTPLESPLVRRPDLLASLVTFAQHHPSLSFLFTGLFVGPTSQAPRVDEARHDALSELEIALAEAFRAKDPAPWLGDLLLRHLLVDVTGNTHRAELCIDKLWDWRTPHGRQGVVELRAFEMPPHPRLAAAQAILARALMGAFARAPYRAPLVRWGAELHDRFLLPTWLWKDFEDVLRLLAERGVELPAEPYRAFLELRCPVAGRLDADGVSLELRNALEPWPVLGEEPGGGGTSRYVDSSVERVEVRVGGLVPERHAVIVNGKVLPLRATGTASEGVAGVRFRAWAPAHALQPHLGIHHPLRLEIVDGWARRSLGACAYHVWHPEGRAFGTPPLTRFEAAARRAQRFTLAGPSAWPVRTERVEPHPDQPYTLDLRRHAGDHPMPEPDAEDGAGGEGAP
jgi:uncharacterized protein (DUF2126 family)/transglutaminase-like putative cysteine protease